MKEAVALCGDEVNSLVGEKKQNVIQSQREVPLLQAYTNYAPASVSTIIGCWNIRDASSSQYVHYLESFWIDICIKQMFTIPYLLDIYSSEKDYISFLEILKLFVETQEVDLSDELKNDLALHVNKYINVLFSEVEKITWNSTQFQKNCIRSAPDFLQIAFI